MNQRQKDFITNKLIPFIQREQGNGFAMEEWKAKFNLYGDGDTCFYDDVQHTRPACGTVACIGGSIQLLKGGKSKGDIASAIGLTKEEAVGLFYNWMGGVSEDRLAWPESFRTRFEKAKTPKGKAAVAVALLRKVVATDGACLYPGGKKNSDFGG